MIAICHDLGKWMWLCVFMMDEKGQEKRVHFDLCLSLHICAHLCTSAVHHSSSSRCPSHVSCDQFPQLCSCFGKLLTEASQWERSVWHLDKTAASTQAWGLQQRQFLTPSPHRQQACAPIAHTICLFLLLLSLFLFFHCSRLSFVLIPI